MIPESLGAAFEELGYFVSPLVSDEGSPTAATTKPVKKSKSANVTPSVVSANASAKKPKEAKVSAKKPAAKNAKTAKPKATAKKPAKKSAKKAAKKPTTKKPKVLAAKGVPRQKEVAGSGSAPQRPSAESQELSGGQRAAAAGGLAFVTSAGGYIVGRRRNSACDGAVAP